MLKLNLQTTKSTRKVVVIMDSIITYLIAYNQYLITIIGELLLFISQHIPLKQMIFDDSNSPEYQKFKVDKLPTILKFEKVDYKLLLAYYKHKYNKTVKPVQRRNGKSIPEKIKCPKCGGLMSIFWTQKVKLFYAALLASNSH